ncbi:MAG TPA: hypothetical protein VEN79_01195, partial [Terriglobia bacterium]|nr:hypothetical protein [Terriglobia bacterium]
MDRREFFLRTGIISAALGTAATPEILRAGKDAPAKRAPRNGSLDLTNDALTWHLEWRNGKLASSGFDNKLSNHSFKFTSAEEFVLTFSSAQPRIEIPGWKFAYGPDETPVPPEQEKGISLGFQKPETSDGDWGVTENLLLRGLSGVKESRGGISYDGYGWFRRWFELPVAAQGTGLVFVLGGYDHQDWNEYWVYANGHEIGHRVTKGRWRTPGQFTLAPDNAAYTSLRFGPGEKNLLAVRTRGFDKRFGGLSDEVLKHYVYEPVWADQVISVGAPYLEIADLEVQQIQPQGQDKVTFTLQSPGHGVQATAFYELEGPTRRKWVEIENSGDKDLLLLDIKIDDFATGSSTSEGGPGQPVFLADEAFAAIENPSGLNQGDQGRIRLVHFPARHLPPGQKTRSHTAVFTVAKPGEALDQFTAYVQEKSPRKKRALSLYTPYGINNQWGGCPPLTDDETLNMLGVLEKWQRKGMKFEYFTLDQGWMDPAGDLTQFAPQCYPNGPAKIVERVKALGMKFGLWFSVSGAGWSCGENAAVRPSFVPGPSGEDETKASPVDYRNGYISNGGVPGQLCVASEPYFSILRNAVLYHMRENHLKFFKLDIGSYYCNSTKHNHLPGKYSVEAMYDHLLDIAASAHQADPDVYVMWYWGVRSPFFALHGDSVFESGLFMEGSATSWFPALYYRDSVTLNLDQSTQFAKTLPPINKDSLGIWLADIRWGNFMGNERWKESMVMDMGRGSLLLPQIWGDLNLLDDQELDFLMEIDSLVKKNESLFLRRRNILGDPWKNEVYGYANVHGSRGFLFINNVHFAARKAQLRLGPEIDLEASAGTPLEIVSHFPEKKRIEKEDGPGFQAGDTLEIWLRPFEVLMLEVGPAGIISESFPKREVFAEQAARLGKGLPLATPSPADWMDIGFADAARFERQGFKKKSQAWESMLPQLEGGAHILAISVRLREGGVEWHYSPGVVEIAQVVTHIGGHKIQLIPVPDARQYGNTQKMGCSWVVYKVPLNPEWSGKSL